MPSNFSCPVRRRRQGETLKRGANQVCRDQDGESLIRISGRDSTGTYLRFHTSMRTSARMDAHVMRDRDPGVSVQTMPFSGSTVRTCTQASLHAITRDAPFILIIINNIL